MKRTKQVLLLLTVLLLCGISLPVPPADAAAAHYLAAAVRGEADGILTLENGETWYKVKQFEDDADYLLTVKNEAGEPMLLAVTNVDSTRYIWNYYRYSMTTSDAPRVAVLYAAGYMLSAENGSLTTNYTGSSNSDHFWVHDDTALCFCVNGSRSYLKYDAAAGEPFSMTDDRSEASEVTLYSRAETLEHCITRQPAAESYVTEGSGYPAPVFSVGLADVTADYIRWYVDGEEQSCAERELTADSLADRPAGVHRVSCLVEAHDSEGVHYRERSADAAFVIAKGVVPDSIMTFSDVHEEYGLITDAIAAVMAQTGGYIPSLVICTGDLVNGPTVETARELNRYYPQITAHLGGLDTVFVAGNHDSAEAASVMSAAADLGADRSLPAAGGLIFDGDSEAVLTNGTNSRYAKGIITYGINFGAEIRETPAGTLYTYEDIIPEVARFLEETAAQYHGELVVISAHSGLHVIGMQPESVSTAQTQLSPWLGENMYNVECSYELAETINRYAEQYNMDILYLFGHDHSRSETELFLTDGSRIVSTKHYSD
ncbi:MAG: metallophosphatase family protein, partial [Oscillospiraceae bacterium]|nr:metallophosphatase family protein [Oscillospiraceae bacterium]